MFQRFRKTLIAAAFSLAVPAAFGAGYPEKTVNYIIPFGPGGESAVSARLQEPVFKQLTGQSMAIQYRPGAGGAMSGRPCAVAAPRCPRGRERRMSSG